MSSKQRGSASGLTILIIVAILIASSMLFYSNRRVVSTLPPEFYERPAERAREAVEVDVPTTSEDTTNDFVGDVPATTTDGDVEDLM